MIKVTGIALVAIAFAATAPGFAQQSHDGHMGHEQTAKGQSASTKAYEAVSAKMHKSMAIAYSGDPDTDFLRGMIPHHQGAIEMAKVVLEHGKDPEVRKLAQEIIAAQEKEIAMMNDWLAKRRK